MRQILENFEKVDSEIVNYSFRLVIVHNGTFWRYLTTNFSHFTYEEQLPTSSIEHHLYLLCSDKTVDFVIAPFVVGGGTDAYIENLVALSQQILNLLGVGLASVFQRDPIYQSANDE